MPMKRVPKSGVYRNEAGHGVLLQEGQEVNERVLEGYTLDGEATKTYATEPERPYFSSIIDAPQDQDQRAMEPVENRMEAPAENRSDAQLAASAAKGTKK